MTSFAMPDAKNCTHAIAAGIFGSAVGDALGVPESLTEADIDHSR